MEQRAEELSHADKQWDGLPMPQRAWALIAIIFGVGLSVLDATIVNVALPTMAQELGIREADSIWIVNAYQLATVMTMLIFAAIANNVGYKKIYALGLLLFTLSSLGCALSSSLITLTLSRIVQGLGAAAMTSINTTLVRLIFPRNRLGRGMGLNATIVAVASVAGPTIASSVMSFTTWHWLFAINIPIGVAAIILSLKFLPPNPKSAPRLISISGCVMNALAFGSLFMFIGGISHGFAEWLLYTLGCTTLIVWVIYIKSQVAKTDPILPFDLMKIPIFSFSVATSVCSYIAQMASMVALPFLLQYRLQYSDVESGFILTAWPFIIMFAAPVAGRLIEHVHAGLLGGIGLTLMSIGALLLATISSDATEWDIVWRLMVGGIGFALFQSPNNSILVASAPPERSGSASGMQGTARLVGQTSGAALVALMFNFWGVDQGCIYSLWSCSALALAGAIFSLLRLNLPLPELLRPEKHNS